MSKGRPLTAEFILSKGKAESLFATKSINLWGNNLDDLKVLSEMPNLEVVSLSVNRISTLKDFANCPRLEELYLRKNCIADIKEIRYLTRLPKLRVLWLHDNPCAQVGGYRLIVIKHLPNLVKLDNDEVTNEEKQAAKAVQFDIGEEPPQAPIQSQFPSRSKLEKEPKMTSLSIRTSESFAKQPIPKSKPSTEREQSILLAIEQLAVHLDLGSLEAARREVQRLLEGK